MTSKCQFRNTLVGAWRLRSYRAEPLNCKNESDFIYPFTKNAKGIIMYTPDGYMSAQLGTMNVPKFSGDNLLDGKDDELINGMRNYLAYSGFYKIEQDGDHFNLRHQMDVANYPNWLGDEQKRLVKLTDNKLTLSTETPIMFNGVLSHCYLDWEKLPQID